MSNEDVDVKIKDLLIRGKHGLSTEEFKYLIKKLAIHDMSLMPEDFFEIFKTYEIKMPIGARLIKSSI